MLLSIRDLRIHFETFAGVVRALDGVDLDIYEGETLGLVGETGCGKTVTAYAIMGLLPDSADVVSGRILFEGEDLLEKDEKEMERIRGNRISMIFQEPMNALNPVYTIGDQMTEVILLHRREELYRACYMDPPEGIRRRIVELPVLRQIHEKDLRFEAERRAIEMLRLTGMPDPEKVMMQYPHELSGGMRQRVMIGMALACRPALLIADEPTTALDVTIQAQILQLMKSLKEKLGMAMLLITHDLGVVAQVCDRVAVMYAGVVVEVAPVQSLFENPLHPYTRGLLSTIPSIESRTKRLNTIEGSVPDLINPPEGCRFHPRCPYALSLCSEVKPRNVPYDQWHYVRCHYYDREVLEEHGMGGMAR
jgi:oligopeptide/dipeptide ABC transporter ATP-binding protein